MHYLHIRFSALVNALLASSLHLGFAAFLLAIPTSQANAADFKVNKVAANEDHSFFLTADGTLWAMGDNSGGQLGLGDTTSRNSPVQISSNVSAVAAGSDHSLFLKNGTLWAVGRNGFGQLGDGTYITRITPVQVDSNIKAIAAGDFQSIYIKNDGTLWAMGSNIVTNTNIPVKISTGAGAVTAVSSRNAHALFIKSDATLWAMGGNSNGQLGDGTNPSKNIPAQVFFIKESGFYFTGVSSIVTGDRHSLVLTSNGTLWAMGDNSSGQLGDGTNTSRSIPVQITTDVIAIAAGGSHSLFVKSDGSLWVMGSNTYGQIGNGYAGEDRRTPAKITTDVVAVAAGSAHSLFVKSDGSLWAMGDNSYGQLGDKTNTNQYTPKYIIGGKAPTIIDQPQGSTVTVGQNATFTVSVAGFPVAAMQWEFSTNGTNWTALANNAVYGGVTSTTLNITNVTAAMDGIQYRCIASNSYGSVTSSIVNLVVKYPPAVITQPSAQAVIVGQNAIFTVTATGNPSPSYQWMYSINIGTWSSLPSSNVYSGGTTASLTITGALLSMDGTQYRCYIRNAQGSIDSGAATLTVATAPSPPTITLQPNNQVVSSNQTATFYITATGYPAPTYQWQSSANGSTWTLIGGATNANLYVSSTTAVSGMQYRCIVTNTQGSATSNAATLTVASSVPSITTQPASQTAIIGANATFTIAANGNPTPTYQWQSAPSGSNTWTNISGATSANYTVTNATAAMSGMQYRCVVTNSQGSATSNAATLTVTPDAATVAAQQLKTQLETSGTATVTVTGAVDLSLVGGATLAPGKTIVGADATSTITGGLTIPSNANGAVILGVNFNGGNLNINGASDVAVTNCTFTNTPVSITGGSDNVTFSWNKFTATAAGSGSAMTISNTGAVTGVLLHDNLFGSGLKSDMPSATNAHVAMFNNYFTVTGNTLATVVGAGAQILSINNIYQGTNNPIIKQSNGLLRADGNFMTGSITGTTAPGNDTVFVPSYSNVMSPAGTGTPLNATTLASRITTYAGNTAGKNSVTSATTNGNARISATVTGAGAITTSGSASVPASGGFTLTATGSGFTLSSNSNARQWYRNNFAIASATGATYAVTNATAAADAGAYSVALAATTGEIVNSGAFAVTVGALAAPVITTQPMSQTVTAGNGATFSVVATGDGLTYQWQKTGVNISGATGAGYTINNVQQTDAGNYTVVVSNAAGSVTSNVATLTVNAASGGGGNSGGNSGGGSSGGGGGGGAPSVLFLAVLSALAGVRLWKRTRPE